MIYIAYKHFYDKSANELTVSKALAVDNTTQGLRQQILVLTDGRGLSSPYSDQEIKSRDKKFRDELNAYAYSITSQDFGQTLQEAVTLEPTKRYRIIFTSSDRLNNDHDAVNYRYCVDTSVEYGYFVEVFDGVRIIPQVRGFEVTGFDRDVVLREFMEIMSRSHDLKQYSESVVADIHDRVMAL